MTNPLTPLPPESTNGEDLAPVYAKLRKEFSAADLQKYTELDEGIPADKVLAEMEAIHRQECQPGKEA